MKVILQFCIKQGTDPEMALQPYSKTCTVLNMSPLFIQHPFKLQSCPLCGILPVQQKRSNRKIRMKLNETPLMAKAFEDAPEHLQGVSEVGTVQDEHCLCHSYFNQQSIARNPDPQCHFYFFVYLVFHFIFHMHTGRQCMLY